MRQSTYTQNEQIEYSMHAAASLGSQTAKSSQLPAVICNAAMQRKFGQYRRWDFHADALTWPGVDMPVVIFGPRTSTCLVRSAPTIGEPDDRD
jgi:hypothetical protein